MPGVNSYSLQNRRRTAFSAIQSVLFSLSPDDYFPQIFPRGDAMHTIQMNRTPAMIRGNRWETTP